MSWNGFRARTDSEDRRKSWAMMDSEDRRKNYTMTDWENRRINWARTDWENRIINWARKDWGDNTINSHDEPEAVDHSSVDWDVLFDPTQSNSGLSPGYYKLLVFVFNYKI